MSYRKGPKGFNRPRVLPKRAPYSAEEFLADLDRYHTVAIQVAEGVWDFHAERYGDLDVAADASLTFEIVNSYLYKRMSELERFGLVKVITIEADRILGFEEFPCESPIPAVSLAERLLAADRFVRKDRLGGEHVVLDEAAADRAVRKLAASTP